MKIGRQAYRGTNISLRPLRKPWAFIGRYPLPLATGKVLIANLIRLFQATGNDRNGLRFQPVVRRPNFAGHRLNVCFSRKRTFRLTRTSNFQGPLSARSGRSFPISCLFSLFCLGRCYAEEFVLPCRHQPFRIPTAPGIHHHLSGEQTCGHCRV